MTRSCTGSGKTHTMVGWDDSGAIPRAIRDVFAELASRGSAATVSVTLVQVCAVSVPVLGAVWKPGFV